MYEPEDVHELPAIKSETQQDTTLTTPVNSALESGAWTQSIIWSPKAPFRDFTQLELHEEDIVPEEKPAEFARPRKRLRTDTQVKDKYNLSNDQYYEVSKEGGRHRVRQTFGQLVVEHAYPAQKLQLPFVSSIITYRKLPIDFATVQNPPLQTGSSILPPSRSAVPFERRNSIPKGTDGEEEEGQERATAGQRWQYRRCPEEDERSYFAGYFQLCALGIFGE